MIQSLQMPVVALMREIAQSANSTHFKLSEISQRMQTAIEHTLELAEQVRLLLVSSQSFAGIFCENVSVRERVSCERYITVTMHTFSSIIAFDYAYLLS